MATSLAKSLKEASAQYIGTLDLGPDDAGFALAPEVNLQMVPNEGDKTYPCLTLSSEGEREELLPGTTEFKHRKIPLRLWIEDRHGGRDDAKDGQYRAWRETLIDAFHQRRPLTTAVPACYWCEVQPALVYDQQLPQYQMVISGMVLWFWTREARDSTAPGWERD